jgi:hypothetical protein
MTSEGIRAEIANRDLRTRIYLQQKLDSVSVVTKSIRESARIVIRYRIKLAEQAW